MVYLALYWLLKERAPPFPAFPSGSRIFNMCTLMVVQDDASLAVLLCPANVQYLCAWVTLPET